MKKMIFMLLFLGTVKLLTAQTVITLDLADPCTLVSQENEPLNQSDGLNLKVSPNPNDGNFTMTLSCKEVIGKVKIKLFNTQGVCVLSEEIYSGNQKCVKKFDAVKMPAGMYSLTVSSTNRTETVKVLITKKR